MGNYNALQVPGVLNITADGTMNYENGEVDIALNFRTPLDYGPNGYMEFPGGGTTPVGEFSGLYKVIFVLINLVTDNLHKLYKLYVDQGRMTIILHQLLAR